MAHVQMYTQPNFILFFDCPEDIMINRLMGRNEGRTDDNMDTIKKRFKVGWPRSLQCCRLTCDTLMKACMWACCLMAFVSSSE